MSEPLVTAYKQVWNKWFETIRCALAPALSGMPHRIEHMGSTAVPGMAAKPIIDIDVVVPRGAFAEARRRLESVGYVHEGDLGIAGREAFDPQEEALLDLPAHHLYVCEEGMDALRNHLAFRDFMRRHPEWRERLSRHKFGLCRRYENDRQAYIEGKAVMVEEITKLALAAVSVPRRSVANEQSPIPPLHALSIPTEGEKR